MRLNLYGQNRHILVIAGVPITGFAPGDFLSVKLEGNAATRTKGADGPSMNLTTDQGGTLSVSLKPTSPALGTLYALRDAQKVNPVLFGIVLTTGVEEVISAVGCAFGELDEITTGGEEMAARKFNFECSKIILDVSGVNPVSGGLV
jgi:hypothetical protein